MKKGSHLGLGCIVIGREEGKRKPSLPKYGCCQSCPYLGKGAGSGSQNSGSGSKNVKFLLGEENLPERVCYKRERGPGPSVTAGVPIFFFLCHTIKANVMVVLLGLLPGGRDGPGSRGLVLYRRGLRFHRVCRIAERTERLEQWQVDLVV